MTYAQKGLIALVGAACICIPTALSTATSLRRVEQTNDIIMVDNKPTQMIGYKIDGNNYVDIEDLALAMQGTEKSFSVNIEKDLVKIELAKDFQSTAIDHKRHKTHAIMSYGALFDNQVMIDDAVSAMRYYKISQGYYFNLREVSNLLNLPLSYDEKTKQVYLRTRTTYDPIKNPYLSGWMLRPDGEYVPQFSPNKPEDITLFTNEQLKSFCDEMVVYVNEERAKAGEAPLTVSPNLSSTAQWWAEKLASGKLGADKLNYWRHSDVPDMIEFEETTKRYCMADKRAENITAILQNASEVEFDIPQHQMENFMSSTPHKANILNKDFTFIGIGYAQGEDGSLHCVQHFGQDKAITSFMPTEVTDANGKTYIYRSPIWNIFPAGTFHVKISVENNKTVYSDPYIVESYAKKWDELGLSYGNQMSYVFDEKNY